MHPSMRGNDSLPILACHSGIAHHNIPEMGNTHRTTNTRLGVAPVNCTCCTLAGHQPSGSQQQQQQPGRPSHELWNVPHTLHTHTRKRKRERAHRQTQTHAQIHEIKTLAYASFSGLLFTNYRAFIARQHMNVTRVRVCVHVQTNNEFHIDKTVDRRMRAGWLEFIRIRWICVWCLCGISKHWVTKVRACVRTQSNKVSLDRLQQHNGFNYFFGERILYSCGCFFFVVVAHRIIFKKYCNNHTQMRWAMARDAFLRTLSRSTRGEICTQMHTYIYICIFVRASRTRTYTMTEVIWLWENDFESLFTFPLYAIISEERSSARAR